MSTTSPARATLADTFKSIRDELGDHTPVKISRSVYRGFKIISVHVKGVGVLSAAIG